MSENPVSGTISLDEGRRRRAADKNNPQPAASAGNGAPFPDEADYGAGPAPAGGDPGPPADIGMGQPAAINDGDGDAPAPPGMVKTKIGYVPEGARGITEPQIKILDPITWHDQPVPERQWLVPDFIPLKNVTKLDGEGAAGKSILVLQLMVACALGKQWLGQQTRPCKVFGLFCEDDDDELHRRLVEICRYYDASLGDLENLKLCCRVGLDNALMEWKSPWEAGETTWLHAQVMNSAIDFGAQLFVADSLHDIFVGNENARPQVRQFVQGLREIAREINGATVFTAHPSLTGRQTGTGESGSTGWGNAVRSRLYLKEADADLAGVDRILKPMKANYGPKAGEIRLRWADGAYEEIAEESGMLGSIKRGSAETAFLDCLDHLRTEDREVTDRPRAGNYAPRAFEKRPEGTGYDRRALERAMERLFVQKTIRVETYGRPSRQFTRIVRAVPETKAKPLGQDNGT